MSRLQRGDEHLHHADGSHRWSGGPADVRAREAYLAALREHVEQHRAGIVPANRRPHRPERDRTERDREDQDRPNQGPPRGGVVQRPDPALSGSPTQVGDPPPVAHRSHGNMNPAGHHSPNRGSANRGAANNGGGKGGSNHAGSRPGSPAASRAAPDRLSGGDPTRLPRS